MRGKVIFIFVCFITKCEIRNIKIFKKKSQLKCKINVLLLERNIDNFIFYCNKPHTYVALFAAPFTA